MLQAVGIVTKYKCCKPSNKMLATLHLVAWRHRQISQTCQWIIEKRKPNAQKRVFYVYLCKISVVHQ